MSTAFTVFEKFGDVCAALTEQDRKEMIYAIGMYGMYGEEIDLPYNLAPIFIALKEDIDNSKESRRRGASGGRGHKKSQPVSKPELERTSQPSPMQSAKPAVKESENPTLETPKPEVCKNDKEGVSTTDKPPLLRKEQAKPIQTKPIQTKPIQREKRRARSAFSPPTLDEVKEYCKQKGYTFDPSAFLAYYESNGWKVGRNPMRDWHAACVTWQRREQPKRTSQRGGAEYAIYDD